jgi:hypothetical protein
VEQFASFPPCDVVGLGGAAPRIAARAERRVDDAKRKKHASASVEKALL